MLNKTFLKNEFQNCFEKTIPVAFERALLETFPGVTARGNEIAKQFGQTLSDLLAEQWANYMADAIHIYVKNMQIKGKIITTGSATTQMANVNSTEMPSINGSIPNTLKVV